MELLIWSPTTVFEQSSWNFQDMFQGLLDNQEENNDPTENIGFWNFQTSKNRKKQVRDIFRSKALIKKPAQYSLPSSF